MPKLEFTCQRGGVLTADILVDRVPETWKAISRELPVTWTMLNARWSGRELYTGCDLPNKPPRENQTTRASLGDIIYACEWSGNRDRTGFEAIGLFYGAEIVRDWRGDFAVNWIGRIDPSQWDLIQEIGNRIHKQGGEDCHLRVLSD